MTPGSVDATVATWSARARPRMSHRTRCWSADFRGGRYSSFDASASTVETARRATSGRAAPDLVQTLLPRATAWCRAARRAAAHPRPTINGRPKRCRLFGSRASSQTWLKMSARTMTRYSPGVTAGTATSRRGPCRSRRVQRVRQWPASEGPVTDDPRSRRRRGRPHRPAPLGHLRCWCSRRPTRSGSVSPDGAEAGSSTMR